MASELNRNRHESSLWKARYAPEKPVALPLVLEDEIRTGTRARIVKCPGHASFRLPVPFRPGDISIKYTERRL
ncbi:uncharacterized protein ALTATR162_LOCUS7281 [Alternaria atra]|uniref:Uncharacterized protein n=1 Tax=Alternaria atra TaxID=119953 RepID=A0A8J2N7Z4_9PLEO|nr:uncharacterized protein ALTATR162_LOCUS7281 [Alternaria atra]CAG5171124.1 unnamed protein product [Alternaria atra]